MNIYTKRTLVVSGRNTFNIYSSSTMYIFNAISRNLFGTTQLSESSIRFGRQNHWKNIANVFKAYTQYTPTSNHGSNPSRNLGLYLHWYNLSLVYQAQVGCMLGRIPILLSQHISRRTMPLEGSLHYSIQSYNKYTYYIYPTYTNLTPGYKS